MSISSIEEASYEQNVETFKIEYLSDGLKIKGYVSKPKQLGLFPCIIFNRGGNREFSKLDDKRAAYLLGKLASYGYVVIASNYRGTGGGEGKEEFGGNDINDVLNLFNVLEEIKSADTSRVGMYGWSRGGMMTYLALAKTNKLKAVVVGGAPSDLTTLGRIEMEQNVFEELIPNYKENKEAELKKRSAIFWVEKFPKNVPILILHGSSDWRVKASQSLRMAEELEKHNIHYRLKVFEGADHGISQFRDEVDEEVINWLDRFVKNREILPIVKLHGN
ncbi:MAG: prolyl oligopeptidase family serine peptidase [Aequorivita antarctica]